MRPHTETYDRIGDVAAWVHDLGARWHEEEARAPRSAWSPDDAILALDVPDQRPAAGRLGVPHEARPADDVAAVGDRGRGRGR